MCWVQRNEYICVPYTTRQTVGWMVAVASFPGGVRSVTGLVLLVFDDLAHWGSNKQSGAAWCVHEAELNGVVS